MEVRKTQGTEERYMAQGTRQSRARPSSRRMSPCLIFPPPSSLLHKLNISLAQRARHLHSKSTVLQMNYSIGIRYLCRKVRDEACQAARKFEFCTSCIKVPTQRAERRDSAERTSCSTGSGCLKAQKNSPTLMETKSTTILTQGSVKVAPKDPAVPKVPFLFHMQVRAAVASLASPPSPKGAERRFAPYGPCTAEALPSS